MAVNGSMSSKAFGELYPFKQVVLKNPDKIFIIRRHQLEFDFEKEVVDFRFDFFIRAAVTVD